MTGKIILGSRGSKLALVQSESIATRLRELNPGLDVVISTITTTGDRNQRVQLDHMSDMGVFVKELEDALINGRIDLAVHSLKDMPTQVPESLCLAAITERAEPGDVLITRGQKLAGLPARSRIGTGSQRRSTQLKALRPDLEVCAIRGNVDTRFRKVAEREFDGIILAAAAMHRLGWQDKVTEFLPLESFLPAVGQGALAIEARAGDAKVARFVSLLDHVATRQSVTAERSFLLALGGGCRAPIASLGTVNNGILTLEGMVADVATNEIIRSSLQGNSSEAEESGAKLAQKLISLGADKFIETAKGTNERR